MLADPHQAIHRADLLFPGLPRPYPVLFLRTDLPRQALVYVRLRHGPGYPTIFDNDVLTEGAGSLPSEMWKHQACREELVDFLHLKSPNRVCFQLRGISEGVSEA